MLTASNGYQVGPTVPLLRTRSLFTSKLVLYE
jgi:hypothetical protein